MRRTRTLHPLEHHPSFRALIAAGQPLAELSSRLPSAAVITTYAIACTDLADGFAAPPQSPRRAEAHHRAWTGLRAIDRVVGELVRARRVPAALGRRAQRAIDRADVLVGALLPE